VPVSPVSLILSGLSGGFSPAPEARAKRVAEARRRSLNGMVVAEDERREARQAGQDRRRRDSREEDAR
jgi:hypothetical protein